jgi:DNA polymerase-3 subunit delta
MRLKAEQLAQHLAGRLAPVYHVFGDEPLLVQEACDQIRAAARQQGFTERELFHIEPNYDWGTLSAKANSLSLFAEKKILELRIPANKDGKMLSIGNPGSQALQEYVKNINPDNLLLVICPKLDAASLRGKWCKALESAGQQIQIWPIQGKQLTAWISKRLKHAKISATPEAISILADRVEGNLLAASQEIEKLILIADDGEIDAEMMASAVADSARYNVMTLMDKILAGDAQAAARTLRGLREEGTVAPVILWAITRELRILIKANDNHARGENLDRALKNAGVWDNKQSAYKAALRRLKPAQLRIMLRLSRNVDQAIKGLRKEDPWEHLTELTLNIAGKPSLNGQTVKLAVSPE